MPYAKAKDGCMLYYKDWGRGDPVVLLHGWPLTADTWDAAAIEAGRGRSSLHLPRPPRLRPLGPAVGRKRLRHLRR